MTSPRKLKAEFTRLRGEICEENLAHVIVRRAANLPDYTSAAAVVDTDTKPPVITLVTYPGGTLKENILTLLHELAHVIDIKRYENSKRWRIFDKYGYSDSDVSKTKDYPKYIKFYLVHCDYVAERMIPTLIRKYKLDVGITVEELHKSMVYTCLAQLWEANTGKLIPTRIRGKLREACSKMFPTFSTKDLHALSDKETFKNRVMRKILNVK